MYRPLAAVFGALNPGLAQTREKLSRVRDDLRELRRAVDALQTGRRDESDRVSDALASLAQQIEANTRELRTVSDALASVKLQQSQLRAMAVREAELEDAEAALARIIARDDVHAHVEGAIQRSVLHREPFPYAVIDDLLPRDVYDALIAGIPPPELFADRPVNKQQLKVPFRMAPAYSRRVWRYMADLVVPRFITPGIVDKFHAVLDDWVRENWPTLGEDPLAGVVRLHSSDGRILLRTNGYRIPPHRDPKWGFLTVIIYLARLGDDEAWGTRLYSVKENAASGAPIPRQVSAPDDRARGAAPDWIDPNDCILVEDVTFKPNRALVFLNSHGAHAAEIPEDAQPAQLQRYIYQFRIGPSGSAIATMMEALPEERRPFWAGKAGDY
jgi:hypothetical protein